MSDAKVTTATTPKIDPPLEVPSPSPQLGINDPGFNKLTTAEKLNDSNYRELVYQAYPDEPTCACASMIVRSGKISSDDESLVPKTRENLLVCRSGCKKACCSSVRQSIVASSCRDNANKDDNKVTPSFMPTYCVANSRENGRSKSYDEDESENGKRTTDNGDYCRVENRLRGGGEGGDEPRSENGMYLQRGDASRMAVRRFDDAWNGGNDCVIDRRLEGGGCCTGANVGFEYAERRPLNRNLTSVSTERSYEENHHGGYPRERCFNEQAQDLHQNTMNVCVSSPDSYPPIAAGCCCPGNENLKKSMRQRASGKSCSNKPSPSVGCLVKVLHDTQEFVESLGKVPGLVGLGLMDPSESPYFGRVRTKESNTEGIKANATLSGTTGLPNPQCTGPCNSQMLKSTTAGQPFGGTPFTIAVPGRGGVVREAVPTMPGPGLTFLPGKSRLKDDKDKTKGTDPSVQFPVEIETGPCGEPKCKAKKRKDETTENLPPVKTDEPETKKIVTVGSAKSVRNSRNSRRMKGINKLRTDRGSSVNAGRAGERTSRQRSSGKMGRRAMSFVYSAGDTYTGSTCGHKCCIEERHRVPGHMGWLWNIDQKFGKLKSRPGWKPGAIGRRIKAILKEAKANYSGHRRLRSRSSRSSSLRSRSRSLTSRGKRGKAQGDRGSGKRAQAKKRELEMETIEPPPTLHIHRKDGTYYVTMYPIKQETMDVPKLEEPMKPLQFKIAKNKDDGSAASSSTASDMEIEFSPPAAVNRYHKKPNVIHVDTQVRQQEIIDAFKPDLGLKSKDKKKGKKGKK